LHTPPSLCNILHNITSYCTPPPNFEVFFRCLEVFGGVFLLFSGRILDGWSEVSAQCLKKNCSRHGKEGIIAQLLCNTPLPAPLCCLQYCAIYFPHDPLYCNKILAISCKGQPANWPLQDILPIFYCNKGGRGENINILHNIVGNKGGLGGGYCTIMCNNAPISVSRTIFLQTTPRQI